MASLFRESQVKSTTQSFSDPEMSRGEISSSKSLSWFCTEVPWQPPFIGYLWQMPDNQAFALP
jgi:hypothetical protein